MARDVSRAQKALAVGRWQRFVRSVKRIMTAVSLVAMAGLLVLPPSLRPICR